MKKLLIISQTQFGYHLDTYYYCKYLRDFFNITYICWDYNYVKLNLANVKVKYISRKGTKIKRYLRFLFLTSKEIKRNPYDLCFIVYFRGCSILKIINPKEKIVLDIRTGCVGNKYYMRLFYNLLIKSESIFFQNITIISDGLVNLLKLDKERVHILPLGADVVSVNQKNFDSLNLLYVGKFNNRKIEKTIKGFERFYLKYKDEISIKYTIIGYAIEEAVNKLRKCIANSKSKNAISFVGKVPHNQLKDFFDTHNIGVSFIPIVEYYDCQPATKTFEYILSGMPTIATETTENKKVVNETNGILIKDNIQDFFEGLVKIYNNRKLYNSERIRETCKAYTWGNIILNNLKKYLDSLIVNK